MYDICVARLLSWLWANFTEEQLKIKFISGEYNGVADMLSIWDHDQKVGVAEGKSKSGGEEGKDGKLWR